MQLFQPNNFFRIMLIVDYEKYIINYAISFDHIIDYAINIIDHVLNLKSTLSNFLRIGYIINYDISIMDNPQVSVVQITDYVNMIIDYVDK